MATRFWRIISRHSTPKLLGLSHRNVMTTPINLEKAVEQLQSNPYYEKYAARIAALQKTDPDEFLRRVREQQQEREEEKRRKFAPPKNSSPATSEPYAKVDLPEDHDAGNELRLDKIFKTELVSDRSPEEVQTIWERYHMLKEDTIAAVIPADIYETQLKHMKAHPTFVFVLPRQEGYELVLAQIQNHAVHFTPLLAFQTHGENATECLTLINYTELRESHKLVLMRGRYDKNILTGQEAQCLANQFQMYYCGRDEEKLHLLETFTNKPHSFKHMDLIAQLEKLQLT